MTGLQILGTGRALPPHIVTNDDLSRRVDTNDEWIVTRTGIRERRFAQGETLTQLTVQAARLAMERAGVTSDDIGLCIVATITPDRLTPAQACLIHEELGLPEDCPAFDLSAGCTGFIYAMETAAAMLPRLKRPCALLVGGELLSRIVDMDDRSTCILFGDGAGAAVAKSSDAPWFSLLGTRGDRDILWATGPGEERSFLHMDGRSVFRFAVETVPAAAQSLLEQAGLDRSQVAHRLKPAKSPPTPLLLQTLQTRLTQPSPNSLTSLLRKQKAPRPAITAICSCWSLCCLPAVVF